MVLVEGTSDRSALEALARRRNVDLAAEGVAILPMGGATNLGGFLHRYGPGGGRLRVAGLYDRAEEPHLRRALHDSGILTDAGDLEEAGFFACDADLEDELIRALGTEAMVRFIKTQGELAGFRILQQQPAHRERSLQRQLHRFIGARSGRKNRYAAALVEQLDLDCIPAPLARLLDHVVGRSSRG